jgi:vitamin B12 transporter
MTLTLAGRLDQHESFGRHGSGQAALAWRPGGGDTLVRASLGQGFRAPSLYQLYSEYGNAGLQPETAVGWDLGLEQRAGGLLVSLTLFGRRTEDQINFATCSGGGDPNCAGGRYGYYANLDRTQAVGLEAAVSGRLGGFDLDASYTRTRARLEGQDGAPDQDLARPFPELCRGEPQRPVGRPAPEVPPDRRPARRGAARTPVLRVRTD